MERVKKSRLDSSEGEQDPDTRLVPFIGYCPVCDTWTREYHIHEMRKAES